jgi:ParB family chromosome partitioning protein
MNIRDIPIGLLDVGEYEQRFDYEDVEMEELTASIRRDGVQVPLIVKPAGDRFIVIEGHRRRNAAISAGLTTVPCDVRDADPALSRRVAFVCNMFRKDPSPIELAVAVAKAVQDGQASADELAKGLGRSPDWVKRQLAIMEWPETVLHAIHAGRISVAAAANIAAVGDDNYRDFLLECACNNGATARTTAAWLQEWRAGQPAALAVQAPAVDGAAVAPAMMPQAPCLCCGGVHRTDELSHVPLCAPCIQRVRHLGS